MADHHITPCNITNKSYMDVVKGHDSDIAGTLNSGRVSSIWVGNVSPQMTRLHALPEKRPTVIG